MTWLSSSGTGIPHGNDVLGLEKLMSSAIFRKDSISFFLISGIDYVGKPAVGRECQLRRKTFELNMYANNPDILNDIYRALGEKGVGREFMIIAKN